MRESSEFGEVGELLLRSGFSVSYSPVLIDYTWAREVSRNVKLIGSFPDPMRLLERVGGFYKFTIEKAGFQERG